MWEGWRHRTNIFSPPGLAESQGWSCSPDRETQSVLDLQLVRWPLPPAEFRPVLAVRCKGETRARAKRSDFQAHDRQRKATEAHPHSGVKPRPGLRRKTLSSNCVR